LVKHAAVILAAGNEEASAKIAGPDIAANLPPPYVRMP
jgi:hypothetical protein